MNKEINFKRIDSNNYELARKIQNTIFPDEDGSVNYREQINGATYRKEQNYCIVYLDNEPIGITGIYSYHEYPDDAWLGWFGILEQYRRNGYGSIVLNKTIKIAKNKGYKNFRLYTGEYFKDAHRLYESHGLIKELYDNKDDKYEYSDEEIYIYSKSLNSEKVELWKNKIIGLREQGEKEHNKLTTV